MFNTFNGTQTMLVPFNDDGKYYQRRHLLLPNYFLSEFWFILKEWLAYIVHVLFEVLQQNLYFSPKRSSTVSHQNFCLEKIDSSCCITCWFILLKLRINILQIIS